jgi:hypothetical protein
VSGWLPAGLSLSSSSALTGTPEVDGTFPVVLRVTDVAGEIADAALTLTVAKQLPHPVTMGATRSAPPGSCTAVCGTEWGDPHLVTFDGATYDFQSAGEFVAVKSTVDDYQIQVRQEPWKGSRRQQLEPSHDLEPLRTVASRTSRGTRQPIVVLHLSLGQQHRPKLAHGPGHQLRRQQTPRLV